MLIKQKSPLLPRNLALVTSGKWLIVFLIKVYFNKGISTIPPLLNGPEMLSSATDKAKLFAENFSMNFNLDDLGIFLPVSPVISRWLEK